MKTHKMVEVYDLVTQKLSTIPLAELGHGMKQCDLKGVGRVWIHYDQLGPIVEGPILHPPMSDKMRMDMKEGIMEPLSEVFPKTLSEWEDGFRRDANAEQEIAVWLVIATRFEAFVNANRLDTIQRKEVFDLMLHCTMVPNRAAFWATVQPRSLTREQVEGVIAPFLINWRD